MISFFIRRPIFATVIALLMVILGSICLYILPISQYPEITPPQIQVSSNYVGAGAETVANNVTTPLESSINGVEGMIYMSSNSTSNGDSIINVSFGVGYPLDIAAVDVLNNAMPAYPLLPASVSKTGVTVKKLSTNMVLAVSLFSPDNSLDGAYLGNYADINLTNELARIPGVSEVNNLGLLKYAIRIWLDPEKMTSMGISTQDVVNAITDQNEQVAMGKIGEPPLSRQVDFQYQITGLGQLQSVDQFEHIIIRTDQNGQQVYLKDIAHVELGAQSYTTTTTFNGKPTATLVLYQLPGANAINLSNAAHNLMKKLSKRFPPGIDYTISYDTTDFVKASLEEVVHTLFEAIVLVLIVVFIFLQSWRATLVPFVAIPVALIGTFALFFVFDFSINTLSMLGLVLAIGLVVDDAIVVVENVEKKIERGMKNVQEATLRATLEVQAPIIATSLILLAVFVPVAFIPGLTGKLYNQFALAIAFSVALSTINSLSLSPALCAIFLKPRSEKKLFLFRWFEAGYAWLLKRYVIAVKACIQYKMIVLLIFIVLATLTIFVYKYLPTGFIPDEDQGFFLVNFSVPNGSSLQRTQEVSKEITHILMKTDGVVDVISASGFNLIDGISQPTAGLLIAVLKPWDERKRAALQIDAVMNQVEKRCMGIKEAIVEPVNPPAIPGLGAISGFQMELEDVGNLGVKTLQKAVQALIQTANKRPELSRVFTTFSDNEPQIYLEVNREKAKALDVPINNIFSTLQAQLGSLYINNYNRYNKVYQVIIQANNQSRDEVADIKKLYVKNSKGQMVPLSSVVYVSMTSAPFNIPHYNLYNSAFVSGGTKPGYSSGQALQAITEVASQVLPKGITFQWTGMTYQQQQTGSLAPLVFGLCLLFVFLFLAALYESWSMPFMILLAVPLALLGAGLALIWRGISLDIYAQIGLILLIGLAAKNAILIVEFAKKRREEGLGVVESAVEAASLRLRPILMTAFAFIFGVLPLALAVGAGAMSRHSIGTTLIGGMLLATVLSLFVVPVFYVIIETWRERKAIF